MDKGEKMMATVGAMVVGILVLFAYGIVLAYPVKWCWNYAMPHVFHTPEIGAMHGFCLAMLGQYFFKAKVDLKCKHDKD